MGGERRGDGKSMGGERKEGGKRDLQSGRRQERWKIYRPSETRQTIEEQDKRPFLSMLTSHSLIYRLTFFMRHGEINKENSILQFLLLISALFFQMRLA